METPFFFLPLANGSTPASRAALAPVATIGSVDLKATLAELETFILNLKEWMRLLVSMVTATAVSLCVPYIRSTTTGAIPTALLLPHRARI